MKRVRRTYPISRHGKLSATPRFPSQSGRVLTFKVLGRDIFFFVFQRRFALHLRRQSHKEEREIDLFLPLSPLAFLLFSSFQATPDHLSQPLSHAGQQVDFPLLLLSPSSSLSSLGKLMTPVRRTTPY